MRWYVEIASHGNDRRLIEGVLASLEVKIEQTTQGLFLVSDEFDRLGESVTVHALAEKIASAITLGSGANPAVIFHIGSLIREQTPSGVVREHRIVKGVGLGAGTSLAFGVTAVRIDPASVPSAAEMELARQRQEEMEHQQRVQQLSTRAKAAFKNGAARKVQQLLSAAILDTTAMNAVAELITADLGRERGRLNCENQFVRFNRSINHQDTFGDQARHATAAAEAHPNPMSAHEAETFIRDVAERWFRYIAERG